MLLLAVRMVHATLLCWLFPQRQSQVKASLSIKTSFYHIQRVFACDGVSLCSRNLRFLRSGRGLNASSCHWKRRRLLIWPRSTSKAGTTIISEFVQLFNHITVIPWLELLDFSYQLQALDSGSPIFYLTSLRAGASTETSAFVFTSAWAWAPSTGVGRGAASVQYQLELWPWCVRNNPLQFFQRVYFTIKAPWVINLRYGRRIIHEVLGIVLPQMLWA